jgi:hypothetical protein
MATRYDPTSVSINPNYIHLENSFVPWAPIRKPLSESRVALVTAGGLYVPGQEPFTDEGNRGDPTFRELPRTLRTGDYLISHTHYDHQWVLQDMNCLLPLEVCEQLAREGIIGGVVEVHYGFMGSIPNPLPLVADTAPEVARRMRERGVDVCVLGPS